MYRHQTRCYLRVLLDRYTAIGMPYQYRYAVAAVIVIHPTPPTPLGWCWSRDCAAIKLPVVVELKFCHELGPSHRLVYREFDAAHRPVRERSASNTGATTGRSRSPPSDWSARSECGLLRSAICRTPDRRWATRRTRPDRSRLHAGHFPPTSKPRSKLRATQPPRERLCADPARHDQRHGHAPAQDAISNQARSD